MPALTAGLSVCGSATSAPSAAFRPRLSAMSALTGWICTPIHPRVTEPFSLSWGTTFVTVSAGGGQGGPAEVPPACRNDAGRHRAAEAERIADRQHPVADARLLGAERHEREVAAAVDLDQRDVGLGIGTDHLGGVDLAVVGGHFHRLGLVDHVIVGDRVAVGRDEEARALAHGEGGPRGPARTAGRGTIAMLLAIRGAEAAEEALHRRARRERRVALEAHLARTAVDLDADRNDRGLHLLDNVGEADRPLHALRVSGARKELGLGLREERGRGEKDAGAEAGA